MIRKFPIVLTSFACILSLSCKTTTDQSGLSARVSGTDSNAWQNESLVKRYLGAERAVRVNARSNYATFYKKGVPYSKWKIATGRSGKGTPKGIFLVHQKEECPPWWNGRDKRAGPCADNNPLGRKALWFHEGRIYGLHGVNEAPGPLDSVQNENPRVRDASSGCVRNHPQNIEWLYANLPLGAPVIVGLWDKDPDVPDCSGNAANCVGGEGIIVSGGGSLLPESLPRKCNINVSYEGGIANIRDAPSLNSQVIDGLRKNDIIDLQEEVEGTSVKGSSKWYRAINFSNASQDAYIHSSLVDCAATL